MIKCYPDYRKRNEVFYMIVGTLKVQCLSNWNDQPSRTFDEVLAIVKELDV